MRFLQCFVMFILLCFCQVPSAPAEDGLIIAAGAGYRRLVEQTCAAFSAHSGIQVQQVFGNMGQLVPQVKESGNFDFILGDKSHLDSTDLAFSGELIIGKGKLIAATARESKLTSLDELIGQGVTRIAIADSKKAIYGHAATEYLTRKGIWGQLQPKLLVVGTVPQVTAYVVSGEVDVGFINQTEALAIASKVGRLLPVDESLYTPILIVAKRMQQSPHAKAADAFIAFLQTEEARALIRQHGL